MAWIASHDFISLTYGLLYLSAILLWLPIKQTMAYWFATLVLAVTVGLMCAQVDICGVMLICLLTFSVYYTKPQTSRLPAYIMATFGGLGIVSMLLLKPILWMNALFDVVVFDLLTADNNKKTSPLLIQGTACAGVIVASILLATSHFHNLLVVNQVYLSNDSVPYTMYLDFDKAVIGILILGITHQLISCKNDWILMFKQIIFKLPIVIFAVISLALMLGVVKYDFKIPDFILMWSVTNLLFVCVTEEAFFRAFIQGNLARLFSKIKYGDYIAITIGAVIFGLVHYAGGVNSIILATIAGLGYGWLYCITKRIEAAIITHFLVNLIHIIFFTYPALAA